MTEQSEKSKVNPSKDDSQYNPFDDRNVKHPTSDFETFIHLLKGSLGAGIYGMPYAFMHSGIWFGLVGTAVVGFICAYCIHILIKSSHLLSWRQKIPSLRYCDIAEQAFLVGPPKFVWLSPVMRITVNAFLVVDLLGCVCVYLVFVSQNIKQIMDYYFEWDLTIRVYVALFTMPLIFMCLVRNLKYLVPFSLIANIFVLVGVIIALSYCFTDIPSPNDRVQLAPFGEWPLFFGIVIFALECIGVVCSLENDMKNPKHFTGLISVLSLGFTLIVTMFIVVGFVGYLKYGEETKGSITLNLPLDEILAQSVKLIIGLACFLTAPLQFHVPIIIIWASLKPKIQEEKQRVYEYLMRTGLVILCAVIAIIIPNLGPLISLIGALCLSTLGLIIPSMIELAVYWEEPGYGFALWRLWVNILLIIFGIVGFGTGTYASILELSDNFEPFELKNLVH